MPEISYRTDAPVTTEQVIEVFRSSGINRPTDDPDRIGQMLRHSNLTITAWHGDQLAGLARSLTDFCFCCYLSDLAVRREFQHQGIGKKLIEMTRKQAGEQTTLLLLAAPAARDYYPHIGLEQHDACFVIKRKK